MADLSRARPLGDTTGAAVSIGFHAGWKPSVELRPSFGSAMKALMVDGQQAAT
ncbi:hypothetical protein [Tabrizicola sp.]|uniref:hypothetical protein n=1 Tax=Tabrizicola sp. TaxID=2005166 RepID=UPI00286AD2A1|nr:hypothetical protein [Tabrizicola sp.]